MVSSPVVLGLLAEVQSLGIGRTNESKSTCKPSGVERSLFYFKVVWMQANKFECNRKSNSPSDRHGMLDWLSLVYLYGDRASPLSQSIYTGVSTSRIKNHMHAKDIEYEYASVWWPMCFIGI